MVTWLNERDNRPLAKRRVLIAGCRWPYVDINLRRSYDSMTLTPTCRMCIPSVANRPASKLILAANQPLRLRVQKSNKGGTIRWP